MSKTSVEIMRKDEQKVLDVLEQHAKENIDVLAKKCGFSRQKLWRIIKHLEANKIIWGYSAISGAEENNLKEFFLLVKRNTIPFDESFKKEVMFETLDRYSPNIKVENISLTHGPYDGIVTFYAPDLIAAKILLNQIENKIGKYLKEMLLIETLIAIRKQGIKNPRLKELAKYI